ncbi:MAG: F0F1 ATP synthase subunit B [Gammaproteobacteria bacterium]|nr:F0F1 ATP synthase subunit B [Gammaproteobacteria bacterium]
MNFNATLIGQSITFIVFVMFCMKFIWPPIMAALEERKKFIADGLAASERGAHEKELAEKKAKELLHEAKQQSGEIIAQAQKRANEMVDEAKTAARDEAAGIKHAAETEVEQGVNRAKEGLRKEVAVLALAGAERILMREVDANAHTAVLDDLMGQL